MFTSRHKLRSSPRAQTSSSGKLGTVSPERKPQEPEPEPAPGALFVNINVRSERVCLMWKEELEAYIATMDEVMSRHKRPGRQPGPGVRKTKITNREFLDHLLDVHRMWCRSCKPNGYYGAQSSQHMYMR